MFTGGFLATFFSHRMEEDFKQDSGGQMRTLLWQWHTHTHTCHIHGHRVRGALGAIFAHLLDRSRIRPMLWQQTWHVNTRQVTLLLLTRCAVFNKVSPTLLELILLTTNEFFWSKNLYLSLESRFFFATLPTTPPGFARGADLQDQLSGDYPGKCEGLGAVIHPYPPPLQGELIFWVGACWNSPVYNVVQSEDNQHDCFTGWDLYSPLWFTVKIRVWAGPNILVRYSSDPSQNAQMIKTQDKTW